MESVTGRNLKEWWAEDGLDLPSADDPVVECYIDETNIR